MPNAKRDQNQISVLLGTSNADGSTPLMAEGDPDDKYLEISDGDTGSDLSDDNAARDDNRVPVMLAVSSSDGVTPVPLYIDSATGKLLVKST